MALVLQRRKGAKIVSQPGPVRLRLVQSVAALQALGMPVPPGPQTTVLGRAMVPAWSGLNGRTAQGRGWLDGTYERRLKEEGSVIVTLPNETGPDGVLHRERLLCLQEQQYRLGDEWIEAWRATGQNGPGDLLACCTPVAIDLDPTTVKLTCYDGYYTLKKTRETQAGFWTHSPRDVFENYTKAWTTWLADGFDAASIDATLWTTTGGSVSPVPSNVRLPSTGSGGSSITSVATLPVGATSTNKFNGWRVEAAITFAQQLAGSDAIYLLLDDGGGVQHRYLIYITAGSTAIYGPGAGGEISQTVQQAYQPGSHTLVIEGRDRWVYYYMDGHLLGVLPIGPASTACRAYVGFNNAAANVSPGYYLDVDYILVRLQQPYLMRGGVTGDYRLPGLPTPGGGLQGVYCNDTDLLSDAAMGGKQLAPSRMFSTSASAVVKRRIDPTVVSSSQPFPAGFDATASTIRWQGAIYLDLATYDYALHVAVNGGYRLWVGKTRVGEQLLDGWIPGNTYAGGVNEAATPGLRASLGSLSGWYPVLLELQFIPAATARFALGYSRSDWPYGFPNAQGVAILVNEGAYLHTVLAEAGLKQYWPLADYQFIVATAASASFTSATTRLNMTGASHQLVSGAIPNAQAFHFNGIDTCGTAATTTVGDTTGFAGVTLEAWVNPDALSATNVIVWKHLVLQFFANINGAITAAFGDGTTVATLTSANGALVTGAWQHVVATYVPATGAARIYVNGAQVATGTIATAKVGASPGAPGPAFTVGQSWNGTTHGGPFQGGIGHVAQYNVALTAAQALAHYKAQLAPITLGPAGATLKAQSAVPASPQGIFDQLVRNDSHYEQMRQFAETWGYQFTCSPRSLESGQFPGVMVPQIREGRDTDYVLDHDNTVTPTVNINADDVADTLLVDAQGLADPGGQAQLFAEAINFPPLAAGAGHLFPHTDYDSPGDIQQLQQLIQRASSLLALRSSAWQQTTSSTPGKPELADTFPLSGAPALFAWLPGDGVRRSWPLLSLEDATPTQILGVQWPIFPAGVGSPALVFKNRPRSLKETLRRLFRESADESRNYQGQLVLVSSNPAGISVAAGGAITNGYGGTGDQYARASLPMDVTKIVRATLILQYSSAPSVAWTISITGVATGITAAKCGRYDVTGWVKANQQRVYAVLGSPNPASGTACSTEYSLELLMTV